MVSNIEIHALFFRQIKNRHGQTLAIMNNGEVRGVAEEAPANKNAVLEFIPTEPPGAYRIRGIQVNLYLAMDEKGKLYGESDRTEGSTIFAEHTQNKVRNTFSMHSLLEIDGYWGQSLYEVVLINFIHVSYFPNILRIVKDTFCIIVINQ